MKEYLIETFQFNDRANKMVLEKIKLLPDKKEVLRYFSHLINSQDKWIKRIEVYPIAPDLDWWEPAYSLDEIENKWYESVNAWINYLESKTEDEMNKQMKFVGYDGGNWSATLKDIALQLNYHSIHHRAQIQTIIRQQGIEPDFVDYIGTKYTKLS
jgi:uncharacterized damage-inducible protein DinB